MKMIDVAIIYLGIGVFVTVFKQMIMSIANIRTFESLNGRCAKIAECIAFLIQIFIWPFNVYYFFSHLTGVCGGKANDEDLKCFFEGYDLVRTNILEKYEEGDTENGNQDEWNAE